MWSLDEYGAGVWETAGRYAILYYWAVTVGRPALGFSRATNNNSRILRRKEIYSRSVTTRVRFRAQPSRPIFIFTYFSLFSVRRGRPTPRCTTEIADVTNRSTYLYCRALPMEAGNLCYMDVSPCFSTFLWTRPGKNRPWLLFRKVLFDLFWQIPPYWNSFSYNVNYYGL